MSRLQFPFASEDSVRIGRPGVFQWLDRLWNPLAVLAWVIALSAIIGKILASPDRVTNVDRFLKAGRAWIEATPLYIYTPNKGFVYGPFSAVCYAMASYLPGVWPRILWCLLSAVLLLGGMWAMMTSGPFSQIPARRRGLVFLLVLPLALGNFDSAQANAFLAGLIMIAFAAACVERWTIAAIALAVAIHWKVYPVVAGMLLVLLSPRRFSWRFVLAVVIVGLIPFLFQKPSYVIDQVPGSGMTRARLTTGSSMRSTSRPGTFGSSWCGPPSCPSAKPSIGPFKPSLGWSSRGIAYGEELTTCRKSESSRGRFLWFAPG